jgi:hypothetical protein
VCAQPLDQYHPKTTILQLIYSKKKFCGDGSSWNRRYRARPLRLPAFGFSTRADAQ